MRQDIFVCILIIFILLICYKIYLDSDAFNLKCIVSSVDGNKYCVREREKLQEAVDLMATTSNKCKKLVEYLDKKYPNNKDVQRLVQKFNPQKMNEILPTSQYVAYSENKGEKVALCLNQKSKDNNEHLIDEHTLMFVALHELSHIMTIVHNHKQEFWENFKFILMNAKEANIHDPADYAKQSKNYCGMTISDNPYYDL